MSKKTGHLSYKGRCEYMREGTHIIVFETRAGLGYT